MTGPLSTGTEVVVSSMEDDETSITVKFWNDNMALCHDINLGQEVRAYALRQGRVIHSVRWFMVVQLLEKT